MGEGNSKRCYSNKDYVDPKYSNTVWSDGSEISRQLWLVGIKCVKIQTYCTAKHMIPQPVEMSISILETELKWMLARLQMNKMFGPDLASWAGNVVKI